MTRKTKHFHNKAEVCLVCRHFVLLEVLDLMKDPNMPSSEYIRSKVRTMYRHTLRDIQNLKEEV